MVDFHFPEPAFMPTPEPLFVSPTPPAVYTMTPAPEEASPTMTPTLEEIALTVSPTPSPTLAPMLLPESKSCMSYRMAMEEEQLFQAQCEHPSTLTDKITCALFSSKEQLATATRAVQDTIGTAVLTAVSTVAIRGIGYAQEAQWNNLHTILAAILSAEFGFIYTFLNSGGTFEYLAKPAIKPHCP